MSQVLYFIDLKDLHSWSVIDYIENNLSKSRFNLVKLKYILKDLTNQRKINIKEEIEYQEPTISSKTNEISIRKKALGKEFKIKKRIQILKDDLVFARLHTQNGLFAFSNDNFVATNTFIPCSFDKEKILKDYLFISLKFFIKNLQSNDSVGRETYKTEEILNLKIPLPDLITQQKILQDYNDKINLTKQQQEQAKEKEQEIEQYLYRKLGIEKTTETKKEEELLQFVSLTDLDRWDVEYLQDSNKINANYKVVEMNYLIDKFLRDKNNSSLRFNTQYNPKKEFKYIGMENIEKENGILLNFQNLKGENIKSHTIKLPQNYFLYGKLRPYLNKYFYNKYNFKNIIVSSEFFCFSIKNIDNLYFKFCLGSSLIQHQIKNHMKGTRMPRISEEVFKNLKIPLPPLEIQNHIAKQIQNLKNEIATLKKQAEENRQRAIKEFEEEVFGGDK